VGDFGGS
jgi:hypothetical protein